MTPKYRIPRRRLQNRGNGFLNFLLLVILLGGIAFLIYHVAQSQLSQSPQTTPSTPSIETPAPSTSPTLPQKVSQPQLPPDIARQLSIASFNIRIFSNKSRSDDELDDIAKVLKNYDIIAIQELRDPEVLQRTVDILKKMGYNYNYEISHHLAHSPELYAFLYRQNKVSVAIKGELYPDTLHQFIREPFYATFRAGNFDFTLLTIHLLYGKNKANRRPEAAALTEVYQNILKQNPHEHDVILLGDFNLPPDDIGFKSLRSLPSMTYLIRPPEKTTVTDTSLYDNFWFERQYLHEYSGKSGVNRFDETLFGNDDTRAKKAVSDHRLIWSIYNLPDKDDD